MYISLSSGDLSPINKLINCIDDINYWMSRNFLKLNTDKTEMLIVAPKLQKQEMYSHLASLSLKYSEQVRNLGIILETDLSFENHTTNITTTAFYQLKNIYIYKNSEHSYLKLTLKNWFMHSSQAGGRL